LIDRNVRAFWWGRIIAVLAGALVLGVGLPPTLGAERSQDFSSASFAAGRFDLEGSLDGHVFTSHRWEGALVDGGVPVRFRLDDLSPQQRVYLPYAIRLAGGTDYAARVRISADSALDQIAGRAWVYRTDTFGCSGTADLPSATLLLDSGDPTLPGTVDVDEPPTPGQGAAVNLCFVMAVRSDLTQGDAGELGWTLQGESLPS
jgi:hypothetical protein